jgi:hypothetical protein
MILGKVKCPDEELFTKDFIAIHQVTVKDHLDYLPPISPHRRMTFFVLFELSSRFSGAYVDDDLEGCGISF